jgi:hypothetical protein
MARHASATARAGGIVLLLSLWLPWFTRRVSTGLALVSVHHVDTGWEALDLAQGTLVAVLALAAVAWSVRPGPPMSGAWMVAGGALALMATMGATIARVGAEQPGGGAVVRTTSPAYGLVLAYAGGLAVLLAGLMTLVAYARERTGSA